MSFNHRSSYNRFNPPVATTRFPPRCPPFRPIINTSRSVTKPRPPSPIKPPIKCNLPAAKSVATTRYHGDVHKNMPRIVYKPKPDSDDENDGGTVNKNMPRIVYLSKSNSSDDGGETIHKNMPRIVYLSKSESGDENDISETASKTKRCSESELTAYAPLQKKACPSVPVPMPTFNSIEDIRTAFSSSDKSLQPIQLRSFYTESIDDDDNDVTSDAKPVDDYYDEAYCNPEYARRMTTGGLSLDLDAWKSYRVQSKQVSSGSDLDSNWNEEDIRNTSSPGFDETTNFTTNSKCERLCLY